MKMQKRIRGFVLALMLVFTAYIAYAETVTVSTFYPSPYGSYQLLDTTGQTNLATAGGNVSVGTPAFNAAYKLDVNGVVHINAPANDGLVIDGDPANGAATISMRRANGTFQWRFGSFGNGNTNDFGMSRYGDAGNWLGVPFSILRSNGNVGIGTSNPSVRLDVAGDAKIAGNLNVRGPDTYALEGVLRVGCDGDYCYAVYAP